MYSNIFCKTEKSLTKSDLFYIENKIGEQLPQSLKTHYLIYNGGFPSKKCWVIDEFVSFKVDLFLSIKYVDNVNEETFENTFLDLKNGKFIPNNLIPFAEDEGGSYFCIDKITECIFFFDMDCFDNHEKGFHYLTDSLINFINDLSEC